MFNIFQEEELRAYQEKKWSPILEWFQKRFNVKQEVSTCLEPPPVTTDTRAVLARHLLSYDFPALNGSYLRCSITEVTLCCEDLVCC